MLGGSTFITSNNKNRLKLQHYSAKARHCGVKLLLAPLAIYRKLLWRAQLCKSHMQYKRIASPIWSIAKYPDVKMVHGKSASYLTAMPIRRTICTFKFIFPLPQ